MTIELDDIIRQSLTDVSADGLSDDLVIQAAQEAVAGGLATPTAHCCRCLAGTGLDEHDPACTPQSSQSMTYQTVAP